LGLIVGAENGAENETAKKTAKRRLLGRIWGGFWGRKRPENGPENGPEKGRPKNGLRSTPNAESGTGGGPAETALLKQKTAYTACGTAFVRPFV